MDIRQRKLKILSAIVEEYIRTGEPIGSKTLAENLGIKASPATIRNDMSSLYDMGLLEQPHTSAGRVPSHLGYRLYIDALMKQQPLCQQDKDDIYSFFNVLNPDPDMILKEAASALSDATGYATVSTTTIPEDVYVTHVDLIPATSRKVVIVVIASNGATRSKVCRVDFVVTPKLCEFFTSYANGEIAGKSLSQISRAFIKTVAVSLGEYGVLFNSLLSAVYALCAEMSEGQFYVKGATNLLSHKEMAECAPEILIMLNEKQSAMEMLPDSQNPITVKIGKENNCQELANSSVVVARYTFGNAGNGALALIGPIRMDYSKIIPHIEYFSEVLGELLTDTLEQQ